VKHAQAKKEGPKVDQLIRSKPIFTYDHIVKERLGVGCVTCLIPFSGQFSYPTFSSALNDLDDALCLCFAFASLTQSKMSQLKIINRCRRLVTELMHYVIEANALRKVYCTANITDDNCLPHL
jgi:pescadillo protein